MRFRFKKLTGRSWECRVEGQIVGISSGDPSNPESWGFLPNNLDTSAQIAMMKEIAENWVALKEMNLVS